MLVPGLSIEEVFKRVRISVRNSTAGKQTPWEASSLVGDFYFTTASKSSATTTLSEAATSSDPIVTSEPQPVKQPEKSEPPNVESRDVLNSKAISLPQPSYPAVAKMTRVEGVVAVQVTINEEGRVTSATAISGNPLLKQAAVQAAYAAKFPPTLKGGTPGKITGVINYQFRLPKN